MKSRVKLVLSIGAIVLGLTLILGFINIKDWSGINLIAFLFIILAEVILFGGLTLVELSAAKSSQLFYRSSIYTVLAMYTLVTVGVSLFFMIFTKELVKSFWTIQLILLAIFLIVSIAIYNTSKSFRTMDEKVLDAASKVEDYMNRLNILSSNHSEKSYASSLSKLAEDLRFTDISTTVLVDDDIGVSISSLEREFDKEDIKEEELENLINNISSLIDRRKIEVNSSKRGGI